MADGWDDWGDGEAQAENDNSEGWDWPTEDGCSTEPATATAVVVSADTNSKSHRLVEESNQRGIDEGLETAAQLARQADEMTEKYFAELQKYQEDLADPSVREEINKVQSTILIGVCYRDGAWHVQPTRYLLYSLPGTDYDTR